LPTAKPSSAEEALGDAIGHYPPAERCFQPANTFSPRPEFTEELHLQLRMQNNTVLARLRLHQQRLDWKSADELI
jgi:hypothetical protein